MALNTIADLSTTAGSNVDVLGQNASGSGSANTIDTLFQNLMALMARFYGDIGGGVTVGGSANAITLTSGSTYQALENGLTIAFEATAANTGATTLNLDGLGAKAVRRQGDTALSANDIVSKGHYIVQYDADYNSAAGAWVLLNPAAYVSGGTDVALADGGTGTSLADPNADRILFWDDSAGAMTWLTPGTGLSITDTTIDAVVGGMTLLGTLTTTSGTTAALTDIPSGYRQIYCELENVSHSSASSPAIAVDLSSTNGAAYATAVVVSGSGGAALLFHGAVTIANISSAVAAAKVMIPGVVATGGSAGTAPGPTSISTNTAAVVNAVRFRVSDGSAFDSGTIRIYGVK